VYFSAEKYTITFLQESCKKFRFQESVRKKFRGDSELGHQKHKSTPR